MGKFFKTPGKWGREAWIRLGSYAAAAVIIATGFAIRYRIEAKELERFIEAGYQRSFFEMVSNVSAIDHALQKGKYSVSPAMISQLSNDISKEASSAQSLLAQLPFSFQELEQTASFLAQAGDWAGAVARQTAGGAELDDDQRAALENLAGVARALSDMLIGLQSAINEDNLRIGDVLKAEAAMEDDSQKMFGGMFKNVASEIEDMPSLIYDGPYSAHLDQAEAIFLKDKDEVSADEAMQTALDFLDLPEGQLNLARETQGKIPAYCFEGHLDGGEVSVNVSKRGGYVVLANSSRTPGEAQYDLSAAIDIAGKFLDFRGYKGMELNYQTESGGVMVMNFAYVDEGVTCYPDLIKVGVALDTGRVTQFEALGYLYNHREKREFPEIAISQEEAIEKTLTTGITLENARSALIPSPGKHEIYCHELQCLAPDGSHIIIYVNVETGTEEKVLILIEDENGTLVI